VQESNQEQKECRMFNKEWEEQHIITDIVSIVVCLICVILSPHSRIPIKNAGVLQILKDIVPIYLRM